MLIQSLFDHWGLLVLAGVIAVVLYAPVTMLLTYHRLSHIPGPIAYALSWIPLARHAWKARSVHVIQELHQQYGPVLRVGPNQVSFNSLSALRTIYGAGSFCQRTAFYKMFDVYGRPNLFTFPDNLRHRERKKILSHMYSNQSVLGDHYSQMVMKKVAAYLDMLKRTPNLASEIFSSLHYFSLDAISEFVYGCEHGGTRALQGSSADRGMILDILDPARRRLSWCLVHFPRLTKWLTSRTALTECLLSKLGLMPMNKPFTYTGIREHALKSFYAFKAAPSDAKMKLSDTTVMGRMFKVQQSQNLTDMDIASECADHLLAGIDTTSDSLMFLIWALSLPQHQIYQDRLRAEVSQMSADEHGVPQPKDLTRLPLLNAVLKESLRLYAPLPAFEPRTCPEDTVIDGYKIPAGSVVGMSPFCLHREPEVFPDPLVFRPERWLDEKGQLLPESDIKNRFFWAFSSGARMCIGIHLANAEMLTLTASLYRRYRTHARYPDTSPGITSRFEVFRDETMPKMEEHECYIDFVPQDEPR